ncbi:MAG: hypothetical protein FJ146_06980 [Deltaproteobacteria bacterium]|nr:hypothetical protein [Deltaproteobacteria bacterium]
MFADRVRSQFQPQVITSGDAIVAGSSALYEVNLDEETLTLEFSGSDPIYTELLLCEDEPYGDHIHAYCSCLGGSATELCPHLWAAVRIADRREWCDELRLVSAPLTVTTASARDDDDAREDDDSGDDISYDYDDATGSHAENYFDTESVAAVPAEPPSRPESQTSSWRRLIDGAMRQNQTSARRLPISGSSADVPKISQVVYLITGGTGVYTGTWKVQVCERKMRVNATWSKLKPLRLNATTARQLPAAADTEIARLLIKADAADDADYSDGDYYSRYGRRYTSSPAGKDGFQIPREFQDILLTQLSHTGRLYLEATGAGDPTPLTYRRSDSWHFSLKIAATEDNSGHWQISGMLHDGQDLIPLDSLALVFDRNLIVHGGEIIALASLTDSDWFWVKKLKTQKPSLIATSDLDQFIASFSKLTEAPPLELTMGSDWQAVTDSPTPRLSILSARYSPAAGYLGAQVSFNYAGRLVGRHEQRSSWLDAGAKILRQRSPGAEARLVADLLAMPAITELAVAGGSRADVSVAVASLADLVTQLIDSGWHVEAEGQRVHRATACTSTVKSGVNWFDLDARVKFGGEDVGLPRLLEALQSGDRFVTLGDGSVGLLPQDWLAQFTSLTKFGELTDDGLRFKSAQGAILDALLSQLPEVNLDAKFKALRRRLKEASAVQALAAPAAFKGTLRHYQEEGLGWLAVLREANLNGCLADDMGLGKTVQVLALLQMQAPAGKPSIIVVPRSLVHNWIREAARFCPDLRVLDYAHADRHGRLGAIGSYDLIVTTYGLLRLDIDKLRKIDFHYAILDEAQAVKNRSSLSAKAARLLKADRRLALSGTPVENHLGELGAIFEFLNPGMLSASLMRSVTKMPVDEGKAAAAALGRALKPFILRRTKEQVLPDLPAKVEQTIYCDLEPMQRQLYDELLAHYRRNLSKAVAKDGLNRTKIQVLEALLRLRQAACHPGLIDNAHDGSDSGKIDLLMAKLREVVDGGHKALVFSQFTSLLNFVRRQLDQEAIAYEYLDGQTRHREERVARFQQDPTTAIFLISLKAGGVGLNLTAADYCFILDPWWNPAAEAQAVDRAHRIGQTKTVFAYRLIARDTIEDKILALQAKKRDLADAIITAEDSMLGALSLDDLNMLLA